MRGLKISALYSFPPSRFGLCGMREKGSEETLGFLLGKKIPKIKKIIESFKGAFFYYKLIAKENKILNFLDEKVVKAYWIGNDLLEKVRFKKLKEMIKKDFKKPKLAHFLPESARDHHSFHVLVAGPIERGLILTEGMKDLCKISWGKVLRILKFKNEMGNLIVEYQPLLKEKFWFLGKPKKRKIFWHRKILPKLNVGDFISFHWDFACQELSKKDIENLEKYTQLSIQTANFLISKRIKFC